MAYNPRMYEHVYGYDLLDTIHNFYPELMYDDVAFPDSTMKWVRHRTSQLFPGQFTHHQTNYRLFQAPTRQAELNTWRQASTQPTVMTPVRTTISTGVLNPTAIPSIPVPAPRRTNPPPLERQPAYVRMSGSNLEDIVTQLFQPFDMTLTPNTSHTIDLLNLLANAMPTNTTYQDVIVAPTAEQIDAGSVLVNYADIPRDTQCAICQEDSGDSSWRKLRCTHYFHQSCVDQWFERDVHCPVCRADIREPLPSSMGSASR